MMMRIPIPNEAEVWFRLGDFAARWKAKPTVQALEREGVVPPSRVVRYQLGTVAIWEITTDTKVVVQLQLLLEPQAKGRWQMTTATQLPGKRLVGHNLNLSWPEVVQMIEDFEHNLTPGSVH